MKLNTRQWARHTLRAPVDTGRKHFMRKVSSLGAGIERGTPGKPPVNLYIHRFREKSLITMKGTR